MLISEKRLKIYLKNLDHKDFNKFVEENGDLIRDLVVKRCRKYFITENQDIQNVLQDSLLVGYHKSLNQIIKNKKSFYFQIVRFLALDQIKANIRYDERNTLVEPTYMADQPDDSVALDDVIERKERLSIVKKCMGTLSSKQKYVVELFLRGHTVAEIARIRERAHSSIKSVLANGIRSLRRCCYELQRV